MMIFVIDSVETIVGNGENASNQHYLFSNNVFPSYLGQFSNMSHALLIVS